MLFIIKKNVIGSKMTIFFSSKNAQESGRGSTVKIKTDTRYVV